MLRKTALVCCLLLPVLSAQANALALTTRLLTAKAGSWTRRYGHNSRVHTLYVAEVTSDAVTLQAIEHHRGRVVRNKRIVVPADYLRAHAADPYADGARDDRVEHKGREYVVRVVVAPLDESDGEYYIADAVPGNGVIRVDILSSSPTPLWTDEYGDEPDDLITMAGPGTDADGEYDFSVR